MGVFVGIGLYFKGRKDGYAQARRETRLMLGFDKKEDQ